jgi:DNA-binding PadR family transcriptional regulator
VRFHVTTLYPLLSRLEERGWVDGRWVEKAEQRRRRYYGLTAKGRKVLRAQRSHWQSFVAAINQIAGIENA